MAAAEGGAGVFARAGGEQAAHAKLPVVAEIFFFCAPSSSSSSSSSLEL